MIKILPIEEREKCKPRFVLDVTIGYGEHCDDAFTHNTHNIVDDFKGIFDTWNYIKTKDAEKLYKFFKDILKRPEAYHHIVLNEAWKLGCNDEDRPTFWYDEFMSEKEIKQFYKFYSQFESLFSADIEHNWYGITDINIYYYDEDGNRHNCEVVDDPPRTGGHMILDA